MNINEIKQALESTHYLSKLQLVDNDEPLSWDIVTDPGYAPIAENVDVVSAQVLLQCHGWLTGLIFKVEEMQKTLEDAKTYFESSPSWNEKKFSIYHKIEQTLKGETK